MENQVMTKQHATRITPVLPPDWSAAEYDALSVLPNGRDTILNGWRSGKPPIGTNLVCTQLRHPALAKAFLTYNAHFFHASKLPARVREILILRVAWIRHAESEFLAHADIGRRAGLTDADIEGIQAGPTADWAAEDAILLRAVDELTSSARITDDTWAALARWLDVEQLIEVVFIVGCYETLAMALNSFNVELEPGAAELDPVAQTHLRKR